VWKKIRSKVEEGKKNKEKKKMGEKLLEVLEIFALEDHGFIPVFINAKYC
jgi:5-carboxymethyl-2-hydroxymuconate isomerase